MKLTDSQKRQVRNYNRRLNYLKSYGVQYLPENVYVRDIEKTYTNARDLNRRLKQLEKFNAVNAKKIVNVAGGARKMSEYSFNVLESDRKKTLAATRAEMEEIQQRFYKNNPSLKGKQVWDFQLGPRFNTLKSTLKYLEKPLTTNTEYGVAQTEKFTRAATNIAKKNEVFKENFADMLFKDAVQAGANAEDLTNVSILKNTVFKELSPRQIAMLYNDSRQLRYFVEYYDYFKQGYQDTFRGARERKKLNQTLKYLADNSAELVKKYKNL